MLFAVASLCAFALLAPALHRVTHSATGWVLAGAFTKSAQFPFHFWLPSAMEAPTPVSAYLHSATMVKGGIYLLARVSPTLGGTPSWTLVVSAFGGATTLVGGALALYQTDLKRILAYSTVSALGTLTLLLGLGSELAIKAAVVFLLAHALYKGALFMVAGTRHVERLGGLRRAMPITAGIAVLAAISLSGVGPVLSFIAKELLFEATLGAERFGVPLAILAMLAGAVCGRRAPRGSPAILRRGTTHAQTPTRGAAEHVARARSARHSRPCGRPRASLIEQPVVAAASGAILGRPVALDLPLWH